MMLCHLWLYHLSLAIYSFPLDRYKLATDCHSELKVWSPRIILRTVKKTWSHLERKGSVLLTGGAARCVEGEHSLNGDIHGRDIEGFKHDLEGHQGEKDCLTNLTASPGLHDAPRFSQGQELCQLSGPSLSHIHPHRDLPW